MPDIIANMIGHNEADRYLEQVLAHTKQFTNKIVFTDDHSTDATVEIARDYGCEVYMVDDGISFALHEGQLRAQSWRNLEENIDHPYDTFILMLDCDELLWRYTTLPQLLDQRHYEVLGIPFFHIWDVPHMARVDKLWKPNISSRLFRYYPGGEYKDRKIACGAEPTYVLNLIRQNKILWKTPLLFEHLGYLRAEDKFMKYKRYMELDGGEYHSRTHLESIIDPSPTLVDISHLCVP